MSKQQFRFLIAAPIILLLSLLIRNSLHDDSATAQVSGFIFLDDGPLTNADIFLVSDDDLVPRSYSGHSNDGGYYEIVDGVPPGNYRVVVKRLFADAHEASEPHQAIDDIDATQMQIMLAAKAEREPRGSRRTVVKNAVQQLPDVYSKADQTVLRMTVTKDGNDAADLYLSLQGSEKLAETNSVRRN